MRTLRGRFSSQFCSGFVCARTPHKSECGSIRPRYEFQSQVLWRPRAHLERCAECILGIRCTCDAAPPSADLIGSGSDGGSGSSSIGLMAPLLPTNSMHQLIGERFSSLATLATSTFHNPASHNSASHSSGHSQRLAVNVMYSNSPTAQPYLMRIVAVVISKQAENHATEHADACTS
nr:hypothetical protein CFP56_52206 [Quercus suber]